MGRASRKTSTVVLCADSAHEFLLMRQTVRSYYSLARSVPLAPGGPKSDSVRVRTVV
jgi:hypothetical protein